jgi:hypothetical protein
MFFQLYSSPGCHPMAYAFQRAYDAAAPSKPMLVAASAAA